ncbi:MAG TPA: hypothetical protein VMF03_09490 [Steroidobacteraceae bacterium]|nr:hypothetical protein [Steroidobacteraceae bacterium]
MPQILYPPARAQTLGEVLKSGARIFRVSLAASLPYGIIVAICGDLANLRNLLSDLPLQTFDSVDPVWWAWNVAGSILALLFGSALILRQKAIAAGERTSIGAELRQSFVLLSRLIVCVALCTVAIGVAMVPFGAALPMTGLNPAMTNLASANVGMLLLLIPLSLPAAWLSLGLFFAPVAVILRKLGPVDAMLYSFRLLRGNWWRTSVLTAILIGVLLLMVMLVATAAAAAVMGTGVADLKVIATLAVPLGILSGALVVPWCGAQVLAMMGDLCVRQEEAK